jgi:hypothetical protein
LHCFSVANRTIVILSSADQGREGTPDKVCIIDKEDHQRGAHPFEFMPRSIFEAISK